MDLYSYLFQVHFNIIFPYITITSFMLSHKLLHIYVL